MNDAQRAAVAAIEQQQKELQKGSAPWVAGEQLKELCMAEPESAALLAEDLKNKNMSLTAAEKKIKAWADKHKTGNFAYVSPQRAEEILREFYGLPEKTVAREQASEPQQATEERPGIIDLAAFL